MNRSFGLTKMATTYATTTRVSRRFSGLASLFWRAGHGFQEGRANQSSFGHTKLSDFMPY
jgi:hypothetical protein